MTATEAGAPGADVPARLAQGSVAWAGIIARINYPYDDAAAMPVMLRHGAGEPVRASRGTFPVPLVYPYPPGAGEVPREDAPDIPRLGAVSKAWVAPPAPGAGGLALHATGTARGILAAELRTRPVVVHADVSGVVSLDIHAGYTVIAIDNWRLCKVVAHGRHHQGGMCRIWQIPQGDAS